MRHAHDSSWDLVSTKILVDTSISLKPSSISSKKIYWFWLPYKTFNNFRMKQVQLILFSGRVVWKDLPADNILSVGLFFYTNIQFYR